VEDEPGLRETAERALRMNGYRVLTATNGADAFELFAAHRDEIDVVLSDVVLPGMDGIELLARVRGSYGPVPFVLTSGYSGQRLIAESLDPAIPFIRKPWTLDELLAVVRRAHAGKH